MPAAQYAMMTKQDQDKLKESILYSPYLITMGLAYNEKNDDQVQKIMWAASKVSPSSKTWKKAIGITVS
jgi:hypothetical protein